MDIGFIAGLTPTQKFELVTHKLEETGSHTTRTISTPCGWITILRFRTCLNDPNLLSCQLGRPPSASYGDLYLVVPKDTAKVGAVGHNDIWEVNIDGPVDLNDLNAFTYKALEYDPETWNEFEELAKDTSHEYVKDHLKYSVWWATQLDGIMEKFGSETLFDVWKDTFPASQFKLLTASNLGSSFGELWTDSECVFIPLGKETDKHERQELLMFSEDFPHLHSLLREYWDESEEVGDPDEFSDEDTLFARK